MKSLNIEPKAGRRTNNFEYWKSGFIHICITDPNIEGLCKKISETGGKQGSKVWEIVPDKGYKIAFFEDPVSCFRSAVRATHVRHTREELPDQSKPL